MFRAMLADWYLRKLTCCPFSNWRHGHLRSSLSRAKVAQLVSLLVSCNTHLLVLQSFHEGSLVIVFEGVLTL